MGVVTDALVMAEKLDGMIVVVRQNYCLQPTLDDTITRLRYVKANIIGIVMTMADSQDKQYKSITASTRRIMNTAIVMNTGREPSNSQKKALKSGKDSVDRFTYAYFAGN